MFNTFPDDWRRQVLAAGVCADICTTILDKCGRVVPSPREQFSLSMGDEQVRKVPEVVAIAGGQEKYAAIAATLIGKWVTTLITDAGTARYLLAQK